MEQLISFFSSDFGNALLRFLVCIVVNWFIIERLYYTKSRRRDFYFTFMLISVAIYFLVFFMMGMDRGKATMGVGLGLFGIFSIMRYRTDTMPVREMTYLFIIVCLSVVHAMVDVSTLTTEEIAIEMGELAVIDLIVISAIAFFERKLKMQSTKLVQYDRIELIKPEKRQELIADLEERLGIKIIKVDVGGVDFLRDSAVLRITYEGKGHNEVDSQYEVRKSQWRTSLVLLMLMALTMPTLQAKAQANDFGMFYELELQKKLSPKWSLGAEAGLRTRNDSKTTDRMNIGLSADYRLLKTSNASLKAAAGYTLLYDNNPEKLTYKSNGLPKKWTPAYWGLRHRFNLGLSGSLDVGRFSFGLRERFQLTMRPQKAGQRYAFGYDDQRLTSHEQQAVSSKTKGMLRSRLQVEYNIAHSKVDPFANVEMFSDNHGIEKMRYQAGLEWKPAKQHALTLTYRFQDISGEDDDNDVDSHLIGLGYKFKF